MENFIFSLNASLPIFLTIIIGWFLMRFGIFNKEFTSVFIFLFFLKYIKISFSIQREA